MRKRNALILLAAGLVTALAMTLTASPAVSEAPVPGGERAVAAAASGDNPTRTKKVKYVKNWVFRSKKLKRCAFVEASGKIIGKWRWAYRNPDGSWHHGTKNWLEFRLKNPTIHVTGWPIRGAGCDSTKRWRIKAKIKQGWYQSSCQLSVDVGVGYPWSIQATPSYKCKTGRVGHTSSTEGPSKKTLHQFNSGIPVTFDGQLTPRKTGTAFSGKVLVRMHTRRASDAVSYPLNVHIK